MKSAIYLAMVIIGVGIAKAQDFGDCSFGEYPFGEDCYVGGSYGGSASQATINLSTTTPTEQPKLAEETTENPIGWLLVIIFLFALYKRKRDGYL